MDLEQVAQMAERNLVTGLGGNLPDLAQFIDSLFLGLALLVYGKQTEIDAFAVVIVLIDFQDIEVKGNGELGVGPGPCKHVACNFRGIDFQYIVQGDDLSAGGRNLPSPSLDADEVILEGYRGFGAEYGDNLLGGVKRTAFAVVILACGFEVNAFTGPTHRPVNPPGEFCKAGCPQVEGFGLAILVIAVGYTPLAVPVEDSGVVFVRERGEHGDGPPVVTKGFCAVFVKDCLDLGFFLKGGAHAFCIEAAAVALGLVEELWLDPDSREDFLYIKFISPGIVLCTAGGVRNQGNGFAQIGCQQFRLGHVLGYFPENIVVIPAVDETDVFAFGPQCFHHQVDGDDFPEVPDMYSARRGDAGSASIALLFALLPNDLVGVYIRPMCRYVLFAHSPRL